MALTVVPLYKWPIFHTGSFFSVIQVTGDTSYPSGGYTITPSLFSLNAFADTSDFQLQTAPAIGPVWIVANVDVNGQALLEATTGNLGYIFNTTGLEIGSGSTAAGMTTILVGIGR